MLSAWRLFVANIVIGTRPMVAHLMQTFRLAKDLESRGHVVTYALGVSRLGALAESQGFRFYHLRLLNESSKPESPNVLEKLVPQVGELRRKRQETKEVFKALVDGTALRTMVKDLEPDLIITDSTAIKYAVPFVAWKIPTIMVSPTLPSEWDDNVPHTHSHLIHTASRLNRYRCKVEWVRHRTVRHIKWMLGFSEYSDFRAVAEHHGLSYSQLVDRKPLAVRVRLPQMILCPREFDFPRARRAGTYFLDSGVWPDYLTKDNDFPWDRLKPNMPLAYCSFGTRLPEYGKLKTNVTQLLRKIIEAFAAQNEFQLVVSVGSKFDMSAFGSLPDNVIIMNKWIPQIRVLSKAAVHITHGGFTSVRESIETEVPMIVIPFDADQPGNAARIVYHNLGVRVLPNEFVGAKLIELTRQVYTSPSFKENVHNMKIAFDRQRSKQSAADIVESLLREKS